MRTLHDKRYKLIIQRLKQARLASGLNQSEVSEVLKRPQSFVSKVENGERRLDVLETMDLISLYGIKWEDILP
jgi:transcriptional regulator with XRE-family HTH domain